MEEGHRVMPRPEKSRLDIDPELFAFHFGDGLDQRSIEERLDTRVGSVFILSIDFCSYSAFVRETPDLSIATRMMRAFCDRSREIVLRSGGAVDRVKGDAIMAFWGLVEPVQYSLPLDAAFELLAVAGEIADQWQEEIDTVVSPRGARAGLSFGEVSFIRMPSAYPGFTMLGDCVNLAARLEAIADAGGLMASNRFRNLLREDEEAGREVGFEVEEVDDGDGREGIFLKNIGSVHAYRIRPRPDGRERSRAPAAQVGAPPATA